jgi:hypothetical protein
MASLRGSVLINASLLRVTDCGHGGEVWHDGGVLERPETGDTTQVARSGAPAGMAMATCRSDLRDVDAT